MSERKYFGTDGIRGRVGDAPITYLLKFNKSKELVTFVQHKKPGGRRVLIKGIEGEN
jgi:phosphomannomutase